ncbi:MAG: hypothetical protein ACOX2M_03870 [Fastidiosipilaceae bacterium]|jgi:transposase-like protein
MEHVVDCPYCWETNDVSDICDEGFGIEWTCEECGKHFRLEAEKTFTFEAETEERFLKHAKAFLDYMEHSPAYKDVPKRKEQQRERVQRSEARCEENDKHIRRRD